MTTYKQIAIKEDIHLNLKRYCCDNGTTIVEAATLAVIAFLNDKKYLNQLGAEKNV